MLEYEYRRANNIYKHNWSDRVPGPVRKQEPFDLFKVIPKLAATKVCDD